jgi:hypothetical protein
VLWLCFSVLFRLLLQIFFYFSTLSKNYDLYADFICTLKIVDESHPKPGISVNIFAESMEKLPHVVSAGDIIQLSHVVVLSDFELQNMIYTFWASSFYIVFIYRQFVNFFFFEVLWLFKLLDVPKVCIFICSAFD